MNMAITHMTNVACAVWMTFMYSALVAPIGAVCELSHRLTAAHVILSKRSD